MKSIAYLCTGLFVVVATGCGTGAPVEPTVVSVAKAVSCPGQGWTDKPPRINKEHVFCGEIRDHKAKGFHSRPGGQNPATVVKVTITQPANAIGVYGGRATLKIDGETAEKFSTMYPDSCSMDQVLKSVQYASQNQVTCPSFAPGWSRCGYNRPASSQSAEYCAGTHRQRFYISMGFLDNGDINTAFPLYEKD